MKPIILLAAFTGLLFFANCKNRETKEPVQSVEALEQKQAELSLKELAEFANLIYTETGDVSQLMDFKYIDSEGNVYSSEMTYTLGLYRQLTRSKTAQHWPIFELKNSNEAIVVIQANGYIGRIWATILIGKTSRKIKRIQFGHTGESEGLGATITQASFENQFVNMIFGPDGKALGLRQNNQIILDGKQLIDGISGATVTSQSVVGMLNEGVSRFETYLAGYN